jgi:hypothetical protein
LMYRHIESLTFICPCIVSISLKYNQQDATHLIHDSSRQQYWFDSTWCCMYSFVLLMMGGGTAWNM